MATTTNYLFPFPSENDVPNGAAQIGALASAVDAKLLSLMKVPITQLKKTEVQSIPNNVNTAVLFGASSENIDTHSFHSTTTATERITPTVPGYYKVMVYVAWTINAVGLRRAYPGKNGLADIGAANAGNASNLGMYCERIYAFNGTTDYSSLIVSQNSGAALNILGTTALSDPNRCMLTMEFIRPL